MIKESRTWDEELVNELGQASSHLSEVLNNTLDISKLEEGKIDLNREFHSPHAVVDVVLSVGKPSAHKKNIQLEAIYSPSIPQLIEIDKSRLIQVVMNLVGNAIKFAKPMGKVLVKVKWFWNCGISQGNCEICPGSHLGKKKITPTAPGPDAHRKEMVSQKIEEEKIEQQSCLVTFN